MFCTTQQTLNYIRQRVFPRLHGSFTSFYFYVNSAELKAAAATAIAPILTAIPCCDWLCRHLTPVRTAPPSCPHLGVVPPDVRQQLVDETPDQWPRGVDPGNELRDNLGSSKDKENKHSCHHMCSVHQLFCPLLGASQSLKETGKLTTHFWVGRRVTQGSEQKCTTAQWDHNVLCKTVTGSYYGEMHL